MCIDDYPADSSTTGVLQIGETTNAIFEWCDVGGNEYWSDVDWFRLEVEKGVTYEVLGTSEVYVDLGWIGDGTRELHLSGFLDEEARMVYTATSDVSVFVSATNVLGERASPYELQVKRYEIPESTETLMTLTQDSTRFHNIETAFDRDFFRVTWRKGWVYEIELRGVDSLGGSLADPNLRIYDAHSRLLARNNNGGSGRDAKLQFQAPDDGDFFLSAAGIGDQLGSYSIGYTLVSYADNAAAGKRTKSHIPTRASQFSTILGELEVASDIDWHRVDLVEGRWYQMLTTVVGGWFAVRDPDLKIGGSSLNGDLHFQAAQTGTHYLVIRNAIPTIGKEYRLTVLDNAPPKISVTRPFVDLLESETVGLQELFSFNDFPAANIQLRSEVPYYLDGVKQDSRRRLTIPIDQISRYSFRGDESRMRQGDISIRALANDQTSSGWVQATVQISPDYKRLLDSGSAWNAQNTLMQSDTVITYHFADALPRYFQPGRFNNFSAVTEEIQNLFSGWFDSSFDDQIPDIANITGLRFQHVDSESADLQIFAADLNTKSVGYRPAKFGGGDIILDRSTYDGAAPLPGSDNYLQILRALGAAMGLKHWAPQLTHNTSIMGRATGDHTAAQPSTFGYWDVEQLRHLYGTNDENISHFGRRFQLGKSNESFFTTIARTTRGNLIDADRSTQAVVVDLRSGAESYVADRSQRYVIGRGEFIQRALGSQFNDRLTGNYEFNRISASHGDDVLAGLAGDDELLGGSGDDLYLYETGDGNDVIIEAGKDREAGGYDTLQIRGKFGMSRLRNDLTFRRDGDDMLIDLDMNGSYNRQNGEIRIRKMAFTGSQVETLDLRSLSQEIAVVSLVSVWNGITDDKQRFRLNGESDSFGLVAVPI